MSVWSFARATLLNRDSPACAWKQPGQAARLVLGAARNALTTAQERALPGGARECPICGWRGRRFRTFLSADEVLPDCVCPACRSFDRHRLIAIALRRELDASRPRPAVLLAFAQSGCLQDFLAREGAGRCFRADFGRGPFGVDFVTDLREAGVAGNSVDWLLCSHVLEHIAELHPCLTEMARMLRPGGMAWIQIPVEPGIATSRRIAVDPHHDHAHAWQFGTDVAELLRRPEWDVEERDWSAVLDPAQARRYGIAPDERYWRLVRL